VRARDALRYVQCAVLSKGMRTLWDTTKSNTMPTRVFVDYCTQTQFCSSNNAHPFSSSISILIETDVPENPPKPPLIKSSESPSARH
jgi:hypothetical protein